MGCPRLFLPLLVLLGLVSFAPRASAQNPDYLMRATDANGLPGTVQLVQVILDFPNGEPLQGLSLSLCHNPMEITVSDFEGGEVPNTAQNGDEVDFLTIFEFPDGINCGIVICFTGCAVLPPSNDNEIIRVDYELSPAPLGTISLVSLCDSVGNPPVETIVVTQDMDVEVPVVQSGEVGIGFIEFRRGDVDGDGNFSGLPDGYFLLAFQFIPGSAAPPCMKAADVDDNGVVSGLADGIAVLNYQFVPGTPPPPSPGPFNCGIDSTPDPLTCNFSPCP